MSPLTVIFIGPQGSGKGTQIDKVKSAITLLNDERKLVEIQTGRLFRAMTAKTDTFAQKQNSQYLVTRHTAAGLFDFCVVGTGDAK